ncbi:MAG: GNAT family N-acetyltransferase [Chloroflexota bacterium]
MSCTAPCLGIERRNQTVFTHHPDEWDQLLRASYDNRIFLTSAWQRIWWRHFGETPAELFVSRDTDGALQAVLPLQVHAGEHRRVLSLLGDPNIIDYMDGLALRGEAVQLLTALWRCALRDLEWDRISLRHVPGSSPLLSALEIAADEIGLTIDIQQDEVCPVALLCSSWDGYLQLLGKKQRHEIRRKLRRAQEDVEWEWRTVTTHEQLENDLPVFFRLHEAGGSGKAGFMTPRMRRYFSDLTSTMLGAGMLRLSIFRRAGLDVAATMGFLYRDRYFLYNSGHDPSQSAYSPGIAAVAHALQDAIKEEAIAFDFLSGDEPYKYQFGGAKTYTYRVEGRRH